MAGLTYISWCHFSWNHWSGCEKVSPGCAHCYAEAHAERFAGTRAFPIGFGYTLRPHLLDWPLRMTPERTQAKLAKAGQVAERARIFVNSMSDVFLEAVPERHVHELFDVMCRAHWHDFLILTKREGRMLELAPRLPWPSNVWMGVSIENRRFVHRADALRQVPAAVRFISAEPLLGPLVYDSATAGTAPSPLNAYGLPGVAGCWRDGYDGPELNLDDIDWLIAGGESGAGARRMDLAWAEGLTLRCRQAGIATFVKQVGAVQARELHSADVKGEDPACWPANLRIREFPRRRAA